jgi:hypothetical protein
MKQPSKKKKLTSQTIFNTFPFFGAFSLSQLTSYPYNFLLLIVPFLAIEGILILFYLNKINKKKQSTVSVVDAENPIKSKPKSVLIEKFEIADNVLKFFVMRGLAKKHSVILKEIPISEISTVGGSGNELSVTWKDATDWFIFQKKSVEFNRLREQILGLLEEHKKTLESNEKATQRLADIIALLDYSIGIVDVSFDTLMELQIKPVNWEKLDIYVNGLKEKPEFTPKSLEPLSLDFTEVAKAIKTEAPPIASKATFELLKTIFSYFENLPSQENIAGIHPNFQDAKTAISAYYTLNDLLLGRIVGEKDNQPETAALKTSLQILEVETAFRVDFQNLVANIEKATLDDNFESIIEESREIFKGQLSNLERPNHQPIAVEAPVEPAPAEPEPALDAPQVTSLPQPLEPKTQPEPTEPLSLKTTELPIEPQPIVEPQTDQKEIAPESQPQKENLTPEVVEVIDKPKAELALLKQEDVPPSETQAAEMSSESTQIASGQQETAIPTTEQPEMQKEDVTTAVTEPSLMDLKPNSDIPFVEAPKPALDVPNKKSLGRRLRKSILGY